MTRTPHLASLLIAALLGWVALSLAAPPEVEAQQIKTSPKKKKTTKKKRRVKKKTPPRGTGGYLRWSLGGGGCFDNSSLCTDDIQSSFTPLDLGLGLRLGGFGFGIHGRYQPLAYSSEFIDRNFQSADSAPTPAFWDISADLAFFPLNKGHIDPWIGARFGFMGLHTPEIGQEEAFGFGLGVLGGVDFFLGRNVAVGANLGYHNLFASSEDSEESHTFWTAQASLTFYWDLDGGSSSPSRPSSQPSSPAPSQPRPVKPPPKKPKVLPKY